LLTLPRLRSQFLIRLFLHGLLFFSWDWLRLRLPKRWLLAVLKQERSGFRCPIRDNERSNVQIELCGLGAGRIGQRLVTSCEFWLRTFGGGDWWSHQHINSAVEVGQCWLD
jgi:hypothetical protein